MISGVLTVCVHGHGMCEPVRIGLAQSMQDCGALAAVLRQYADAESRIIGSDAREFLAGPIGASIDDHPDRPFLPADCRDGIEKPCAGVVAGNDHRMAGCGDTAAA